MTDDANPFDGYHGADVAPDQQPAAADEPNPFDGYADDSLQPAPAPSEWESIATNLSHGAFGLLANAGDTVRTLEQQRAVRRAQTVGVAAPGDSPFSGKPAQAEVDNALGALALAQADRERYDSFHSEGVGGKAAALFGATLGVFTDPTNFIPVGRAIDGVFQVAHAVGVAGIAAQIAARAGEFGVFSAATDAASQGLDIAAGHQQGFDQRRLLFSTALGTALGGGMGGAATLIRGLRGELPGQVDAALESMAGRLPEHPPLEQPANSALAPAGTAYGLPGAKEAVAPAATALVNDPLTAHARDLVGSLAPEDQHALHTVAHEMGLAEPPALNSASPYMPPQRIGAEATGRLADQIAQGPTTIGETLSAPAIRATLGNDVPGIALSGVKMDGAGASGLVAFHGSPHEFDRFSLSAIDSGEGNQAFGHGLYFAQSKGIAEGYQARLAKEHRFDSLEGPAQAAAHIMDSRGAQAGEEIFRKTYRELPAGEQDAAIAQARAALEQDPTGHLYQVHIDTTPERMLDWDKPLDQQPAHVQEALAKLPREVWNALDSLAEERGRNGFTDAMDAYTGKDLVKHLQHYEVHDTLPEEVPSSSWYTGDTTPEKHTTAVLNSLGIDGIQYFDGASRKAGEGPRNFVIFDDSKIKVTHKNGVALDKPVPLEQFLKGEVVGRLGEHLKAHADYVRAHEAVQTVADDGAIARSEAQSTGRASTKPPRELSALEYLAHAGGLADHPEVRAVLDGNPFVPGAGRLIRKNGGMSLDDALQSLKDAGYLFDPADHARGEATLDHRAVLDVLDREARGEKVYPHGSERPAKAIDEGSPDYARAYDEAQNTLRSEAAKYGFHTLDPMAEHRAADLVASGHETDHLAAYERALMEEARADELYREAGLQYLDESPYHDFLELGPTEAPIPFDLPAAIGDGPGRAEAGPGASGEGRALQSARDAVRADGEGAADLRTGAGAAEREQALSGGAVPEGVGSGLFNGADAELPLRARRPQGPNAEFRRRSNRAELPGEAATAQGPQPAVADHIAREHRLDATMRDIAVSLGRRLEIDGRMKTSTLGTYKPGEGVLRIRFAGDLEVFAHEMGHAVDQILSNDPAVQQAWAALRTARPSELLKMDYNATVRGGKPQIEEGVAEFLRTFMTNPAYARAQAPATASAFDAILARKPDLAELFRKASHLSQVESGLNPMQVFGSMIAEGEPNALEAMSRSFARDGLVPTLKDYAARIYGGLVRENVHFDRLTQFLRDARFQKTGTPIEKLSFKQDPDVLYRQLPGARQMAVDVLERGVPIDPNDPFTSPRSPSLNRAIETALNGAISRIENENDPLVRDFSAYLVARRARGEWQRFKDGQLRNQPVRASENETRRAITDFEARYPQFQKAADDVFAFQRAYLQRRVDKNLLSADSARAFMGARDEYVPFYRSFEGEKAGAGGGGQSFLGLQFGDVKRFGGSTRDIKNVMRSMIEDVSRTERRIAENDVLIALDDLAKQAGELAGPVWEHVPNEDLTANTVNVEAALRSLAHGQGLSKADTDIMISNLAPMVGQDMTATLFGKRPTDPRGERVLFMYRGGTRQAVKLGDNEISKHFFDLVTAMSAPEKDVFLKMMGAVNSAFQASITHAPRFIIGTLIRDNMTRMFIPRQMGIAGRIPSVQDLVGAYSMLFDRSFFRAYQAGGGIRGGTYSHAANELTHDALAAAASSSGFASRTLDELAAANTLGAKAGVISRVPANLFQSGKFYGQSLIDRVRYRDGIVAKGWVVATTPFRLVSDVLRLTELGETASRVGGAKLTFRYLKKQGLSDAEAMMGALHESRDVLNYNSHGSNLRMLARLSPFMQAAITGADRSARGLIAEPIMAAMRAMERGGYAALDAGDKAVLAAAWKNWLMIGGVAGVGAAVYYPAVKDTELYRRASNYIKDHYYLIQTGEDADGNPVGLTIHKGYDIPAAIQTTFELMAEELRRKDPTNWSRVLSALSEAVPRQFHSVGDFLGAFPAVKTAYEVKTGMKLGFEGGPARPIVPDKLKSLPPEQQQTAMTSWFAKQMAKTFGISPMVADHVIDSMGGTGGQDVKDLASAVFDNNPMVSLKDSMNRFFFGQAYRTMRADTNASHDLMDLMARNHGSYKVEAAGYKEALEAGDTEQANAIYNRAGDVEKALMTLESSYRFKPQDRALHPLERSSDIASVVYDMTRNLGRSVIQMQDRSHKRGEEREVIDLTSEQARQVSAQMNMILAEETRNGLAMVGHPGYQDYDIIDTAPRREILRQINPDVADEFQARLKAKHVLPADVVANNWPEVQRRLLTDRDRARLSDLRRARQPAGGSQLEPASP